MHSVHFVSNWSSSIETYAPHQGNSRFSHLPPWRINSLQGTGESKLSQFWIPTNTSSFWKRHFLHQIIHFGDRPLSGPIFPRHHHKAEERIAHKAPHEVALQANVTWALPCHDAQRCWIDGIRWIWTIWISKIQRNIPSFVDHDWTTIEPGDLWNRRLGNYSILRYPTFGPQIDETVKQHGTRVNLSRDGRCSGRWETVRFERAATRRMAWQRPHDCGDCGEPRWANDVEHSECPRLFLSPRC